MMITTIFSLAEIFNLHIVAEGVETGEQFRLLLEHDCKIFQGFYFAKPMNEKDFEVHVLRQIIKKVNSQLNTKKEKNQKLAI